MFANVVNYLYTKLWKYISTHQQQAIPMTNKRNIIPATKTAFIYLRKFVAYVSFVFIYLREFCGLRIICELFNSIKIRMVKTLTSLLFMGSNIMHCNEEVNLKLGERFSSLLESDFVKWKGSLGAFSLCFIMNAEQSWKNCNREFFLNAMLKKKKIPWVFFLLLVVMQPANNESYLMRPSCRKRLLRLM